MGFFTDFASEAYASYIQGKDTEDMLKSLVFIASYKATLNRDYKKLIANVMKNIDEDFSVFRDEEKIDAIYNTLKDISVSQFFKNILSLRIDRDKIVSFFTIDLFFILALQETELIMPQHIYNLYLVKKHFAFSRQELASCYKVVAELQGANFDDTAEAIEALTSAEAIDVLVEKYPNLIESEIEVEKELPTKNLLKIEEDTVVEQENSVDVSIEQENIKTQEISKKSKKSRLTALLLCLLLGAISAHRFYVGKIGTAIFQIILVAVYGIGIVWVVIDLIIIIVGKFKDKNGLILTEW